MAKSGAYIRDVNSLEDLNSRIVSSGDAMANIDAEVVGHLNVVRDTLDRQLDIIQDRLRDAEQRLSAAESALRDCQSSQSSAMAMGAMGPSCDMEAQEVEMARMEVEKWRMREEQGQQIVQECQRETEEYNGPGGGHNLVQRMYGEQTPKASQLLRGCIEKLNDILGYDTGTSIGEDIAEAGSVAGVAGLAAASTSRDKFSVFNMGATSANESWYEQVINKNNKDLENALGIKQGPPMKVEEADMQKANPHYVGGTIGDVFWWGYGENCATTAPAYALRLRGFDVTAKGNWGLGANPKNSWVSYGDNVFKIWKNADGSDVKPVYTADWMRDNSIGAMTADDYKRYFEETCKDKGVYILGLKWKGGGGHATILQRDDDGLHLIEPQVFEGDRTSDGRRSIDDLLSHKSGLSMYPRTSDGILRVDDKLFDTEYVDMFNVNK